MKIIDKYGNLKTTGWNGGSAGGDLSGTYPSPTVLGLNSFALSNFFRGYIYGYNLSYVSTTSIKVGAGQCTDNTASVPIVLGTSQTISTGSLGTNLGLDRQAMTGTVATSTSNATVTGTGTQFFSAFGTRTGTGTYSTSTTTVTGVGTKFLSELSVGDLIGDTVNGFARVTAVNSDTSATLAVSLPGGNASSSAFQIIENAHFQANGTNPLQVNSITSNTTLTLSGNSSATVSGVTGYVGALPAVQTYLMVWAGSGTSGTGVWLSTQRTTPYAPTGFGTYVRRIGSIIWDGTASTILPFVQEGSGTERWYQFEVAINTHSTRILSAGNSTSWARIIASACAPPTASKLHVSAQIVNPSGGINLYLRDSSTGDATTSRPFAIGCSTSAQIASVCDVLCDGSQAIDYCNGSATVSIYIDVSGYQESLTTPSSNTSATSTLSSQATSTIIQNGNILINGGFDFAQRQTPGTYTNVGTNAADKYGPDRWKIGIQNGIATAQAKYARIDNAGISGGLVSRYNGNIEMTGAASKAMIYQIVEGVNSLPLAGQTVTFQAMLGTSVSAGVNVNLGLLYLTNNGTIDTIPTILNTSWANGAGNDPVWGSNLALAGNKATFALDSSGDTLCSVTVTLPGSIKNVIPVIWTDSQMAVNDTLGIAQAALYLGSSTQTWLPRPEAQELALCERYYEKAYNTDDTPGTTWSAGATSGYPHFGLTSGSSVAASVTFREKKRVVPTLTFYNAGGGSGSVSVWNGGWTTAAPATSGVTQSGLSVQMTTSQYYVNFAFTADAEL